MKTKAMQSRLEALFAAGEIQSGETYNIMPSGCAGDGYDIAISPRTDESGDYQVGGHLMRVTCAVRVGSRNWHDGIPAGYRLECNPAVPYHLEEGERAELVERTGSFIGNFMERTMASIAIRKADGKLRRQGRKTYWLGSTNTYASHHKSGRNRRDEAAYRLECERLRAIVAQINGA